MIIDNEIKKYGIERTYLKKYFLFKNLFINKKIVAELTTGVLC